jgi:hypothetical protein
MSTTQRRTGFGRGTGQYTRKFKKEAEKQAKDEEKIKLQKQAKEAEKQHQEYYKTLRANLRNLKPPQEPIIRKHVIYSDGREEYYDCQWRLHRDSSEGPAVIPVNGEPEYWNHGRKIMQ